jgi:hypothetical protein
MPQDEESRTSMSFPARAVAIFTEPSRVFQELVRRPAWLAPLLAVTLAIAALNAVVVFSETGQTAMRQEIQEKIPQGAPPDLVDRQMAVAKFAAPISVFVFVPLVTLVLAGLVYLIFSIVMGGEATYRQTFSAYCHASLIGIVGALVGTGMIFLKGNVKSSTALSAFLPFLDEKSMVFKFTQMLDLFIIWQLAVLSIGMGILSRVSTRKAATVIFSVYLVLAVIIAVVRQMLS